MLPVGGALLEPLAPAYAVAYGSDWLQVLEGAWRSGRSTGELPRLLRQGARLGVSELAKGGDGAGALRRICDALRFGLPDGLATAYGKLVAKEQLPEADREAIGRFEALVDARIDAALGLAETRYQRLLQLLAAAIALALAFLIAFSWPAATSGGSEGAEAAKNGGILASPMAFMLFAGVLAIPLAPTFKNIASALDEAVTRLRGGK